MQRCLQDSFRGSNAGGNISGPAGIILSVSDIRKGQVAAVRPLLF